jgi:hypothetical protein
MVVAESAAGDLFIVKVAWSFPAALCPGHESASRRWQRRQRSRACQRSSSVAPVRCCSSQSACRANHSFRSPIPSIVLVPAGRSHDS